MLVEIELIGLDDTVYKLEQFFRKERVDNIIEYFDYSPDPDFAIVKIDETSTYPTVDDFFDALDEYNKEYRVL